MSYFGKGPLDRSDGFKKCTTPIMVLLKFEYFYLLILGRCPRSQSQPKLTIVIVLRVVTLSNQVKIL